MSFLVFYLHTCVIYELSDVLCRANASPAPQPPPAGPPSSIQSVGASQASAHPRQTVPEGAPLPAGPCFGFFKKSPVESDIFPELCSPGWWFTLPASRWDRLEPLSLRPVPGPTPRDCPEVGPQCQWSRKLQVREHWPGPP